MRHLRIDALQIFAEADSANSLMNDGAGQRLNIVRLDGEYYYVDTTWTMAETLTAMNTI